MSESAQKQASGGDAQVPPSTNPQAVTAASKPAAPSLVPSSANTQTAVAPTSSLPKVSFEIHHG